VTPLGGRTTWGRSHGSRMWMSEGVLGSSKKASGRLGKVCQWIYLVSPYFFHYFFVFWRLSRREAHPSRQSDVFA
jgi:hypothetical protein